MKSKQFLSLCCIFICLCGCQAVSSSTIETISKEEATEVETKKTKEVSSQEIETAVLSYLEEATQNVGIYYRDLESGESFSINADTSFRSASIAKLFVCMYGYEQIQNGLANEMDLLYYQSAYDYEGGTGILQSQDLIQPITLGYALEVAITHSDNIAYNMLMRHFGAYNVMAYYEQLIKHETPKDYVYMSANDAQLLLTKINEETYLQDLKRDMKNTIFEDKIATYLPSGIVAHKIGNFNAYAHDVAIIDSEQPYIITIFTYNLNDPESTIAEISQIIYEIKKK